MSDLFIIDHPLVQSKLALLRDKNTNNKEFRELVSEVSGLLAYEATRDMEVKTENIMPIEYYCKLPEYSDNIEIFVLEPMMATGGTASAAVQFLKERNFKNIKYICLICTPDGVQKLQADHPDVDVYAAAMDRTISEDGFIIPGLGDAGDRMFGTK